MPDRIVGGRIIPDNRLRLRMELLQTLAEPVLEGLYHGIARKADADIDQLLRLFYDGAWRDHGGEIVTDIQAFADLHPLDEQRTDEAIKAWAHQCGAELEGDYSQSYYRIATHVGLVAYVRHMRELRARLTCDIGWHRIVECFHEACSVEPSYGFLGAHEKWGGLRLTYLRGEDAHETCLEAQRIAVERAAITCEKCGRHGELRQTAWRKTLCDQHAEERYDD
ncbi:hypothetical protein [Rhizobium leguminosarum]|uniref:hypothetical protein n=1 Tax=Rhizobium leguminosarum TaxID=384 RepID=UPI003F9DEB7C